MIEDVVQSQQLIKIIQLIIVAFYDDDQKTKN